MVVGTPSTLVAIAFFGFCLASRAIMLSVGWDSSECCSSLFTMFESTGVSVTGTCTGQELFTLREFADVTLLRRRVSITIWANWTGTGISQPVPTDAVGIAAGDKTNLVRV